MKRLVLLIVSAASLWGEDAAPSGSGASTAGEQGVLPAWLKLSGEIRGRGEGLNGIGYVPGAEDGYYLHRIRFGATVHASAWLRGFVQVQDSRVAGWDRGVAPATVANALDVRQAYLEAGAEEGPGWRMRFGRQPLVFGDMRLVSTSNWGNVGPAYDGARLSYSIGTTRLDWFATELVTAVRGGWDCPRSNRRLHGFYSAFGGVVPKGTLETYFFWKQNALPGVDLRVYTSGAHLTGKVWGRSDYNVEAATQWGRDGVLALAAWASHWEAGQKLGDNGPRLSAEYNYASGDSNSGDGQRGTFDNLYPTDKFGTADGIAWRNIHEPVLSAEWKPANKWKTKLAWHGFWLANRNDALYAINGAVLARNPSARSSHVGSEVDLRLIWQKSKHLQLWGGYAYFFAGPYLRESSRGSGIHCPYVMWIYTF